MATNSARKTVTYDVFAKQLDSFCDQIVSKPELFAGESKDVSSKVLAVTKLMFDYAKSTESAKFGPFGPFKTLIVDGFDPEQIWEEIQLRNEPLEDHADAKIEVLLDRVDDIESDLTAFAGKTKRQKIEEDTEDADDQFDSEDLPSDMDEDDMDASGDDEDDEEDGMDQDEEEEEDDDEDNRESGDGSGEATGTADDMFFDNNDLEAFLEEAEMAEAGVKRGDVDSEDDEAAYEYVYGSGAKDEDDEEDDGLDSGYSSDEGDKKSKKKAGVEDEEEEDDEDYGAVAKFSDFFSAPQRGSLEDAENDDAMDEDGGEDDALELDQWAPNAPKARGVFDDSSAEEDELIGERGDKVSRFEAQQERLRRKIGQLEDEAVAPKQWQLIGEVRGVKRPENSLLEETLEFEHATKVAPPVTEDRMRSIEEIIKKRILDHAFDDVIRRKADDIVKGDSRQSTAALDSEKSKKSLSDIYEDEFMKQTQGVQQTSETAKLHADAAQLFRRICIKLDALSNQNYTPLKVKEPKVRKLDAGGDSNATAAIRMEEVTPVAVSEAVALAPEEIYQKPRREIRGESELTSEDRKKMRRDRKEKGRKEKEVKASREREDLLRNPEKRDQLQSTAKAMESIKGSRNVTFAEGAGKQHKNGGSSGEKYSSSAFFGRLQAAKESGTLLQNPKKRERPSSDKSTAQFKL